MRCIDCPIDAAIWCRGERLREFCEAMVNPEHRAAALVDAERRAIEGTHPLEYAQAVPVEQQTRNVAVSPCCDGPNPYAYLIHGEDEPT